MSKKCKKRLITGVLFLAAFAVWTLLVKHVDVRAIGPNGTLVGFASINKYVHSLFGVNTVLYSVTDWLGLVPIFMAFSFAVLGLFQWIKRKSLLAVDKSILLLGVFYAFVAAVYIFFEFVIINYRPILINGCLEPSYPSSTTLLALSVMPTTLIQIKNRIKGYGLRVFIELIVVIFTAFMAIGRIFAGVHWITDIFGGAMLSCGLVRLYSCGVEILD